MTVYTLVRSVYRWADRKLLTRLPGQRMLRAGMFRIARTAFPGHIQARSVSEFTGTAPGRRGVSAQLPAWARDEVAILAQFEPALSALVGDDAALEPYFIPWDLDYVGERYAQARRQLTGDYACMVLSGAAASAVDMVMLADMPRPLAVIDVVGDSALEALARMAGADYVALPAERLTGNDHCSLIARLVLQVAPAQLRTTPHPRVALCVQRHGLAMATVTDIFAWSDGNASAGCQSAALKYR